MVDSTLGVDYKYAYCHALLDGVIDTITIYSMVAPQAKIVCFPPKVDSTPFLPIVLSFIKANPSTEPRIAALDIVAAMQRSYPCPK